MAQRPVVRVDVWSDISCPWCWVGKKRMDQALAQLEQVDFEVVYHAYVIDHKTDPGGEQYLAYNRRRWGGDGWTGDLRRSGSPDGATFADWVWWPSSLKGHQLLLLAQEQGKGREAKDLLLRYTYEQGENVSDIGTLVRAGRELGLDEGEVRRHLAEDRGRAAVLRDDETGKRELGISGVPYFIVGPGGGGGGEPGRRYALSGAQPAAAFVKAVGKVLAEQAG